MSPEELTEAERRMRPDFVATVPRGEPMTHEQANGLSSNPKYNDPNAVKQGYHDNCQSCVVSYAMRLRGYEVEARNRDYNNEAQNQLSLDTTVAWIDPTTGRRPRLTAVPVRKASKGLKWLMDNLKNGGVYTFEFEVNDSVCYGIHIIILTKNEESLTIYDPQKGIVINNKIQMRYLKSIDWKARFRPKIMRIDQLEPNITIVNEILRPKVKDDTNS